MITTPKTKIDQFISTGVGLLAVGKKVKIIEKHNQATAKTLIGIPSLPSENLEGGIPAGRVLALMKDAMERMYVVKRAAIITDATALNAAVDPMLIRLRSTVMIVETRTETTGIWVRELTWARLLEKGRALSRAKAKVCREAVARILIALQTSMIRMMAAMPFVAACEPVA